MKITTSSRSNERAWAIHDKRNVQILYDKPIKSTRKGSIFNAHEYPTKINPEAIVPFVLAHTKPNDVVFDCFAGGGATGLAAVLCERPNRDLEDNIEVLFNGGIEWGPRDVVLYDSSTLATFICENLLNPPDPRVFSAAAHEVLRNLEKEWGWLYGCCDSDGKRGVIRHVLWTDYPICPLCGNVSTYWDLAVELDPPAMAKSVRCPKCQEMFTVAKAGRHTEDCWDPFLNQKINCRTRTPVFLYGRTGTQMWKREVINEDLDLIKEIEKLAVPKTVPIVPFLCKNQKPWGELHRSGYHHGISHLHHFYTRRNLIAVGAAFEEIAHYPEDLRAALQFWISSYNSSHSTLMTRVVCKKNAKDLVVTSAQPAALYISSLPVEKNVFLGLKRKMKVLAEAFRTTSGRTNLVTVKCTSSSDVDLQDESIDYVFTDPPFGDNIQYSEVNFINEAWLGRITDSTNEAIISSYQNKSVENYQALLTSVFDEAFRLLKPNRFMTVAFHSSKRDVWDVLRSAWEAAGFKMLCASILDKEQSSFKQVTTAHSVKGDSIILLQKQDATDLNAQGAVASTENTVNPWDVISKRLKDLDEGKGDSTERTKQRLYSYLISYYLERRLPVPLNAKMFFRELNKRFRLQGDLIYLTEKNE